MIVHASRKNSSDIAKQICSWNSQEECRRERLWRRCKRMRRKLKQWKDCERRRGNTWIQSQLALLRRGPGLRSEARWIDLTFYLIQNSHKYNFIRIPVAMWSKT